MRAVTVAVTLVLVVAGCSGSETEETAGTPTTSQTAAETHSDTTAPAPTVTARPVTTVTPTSEAIAPAANDEPSEATSAVTPALTATSDVVRRDDGGGRSLGALGDTELRLDTDDGVVQIGDGTIPVRASAIPMPDDRTVELVTETADAAGFTATSAATIAELAAFYRAELPLAGFDITSDERLGDAVQLSVVGRGAVADILLAEAPGGRGTTIVVAISGSE